MRTTAEDPGALAPDARTARVRADAPDRLEASLVGAGPHVEPVLDVGTTGSGDLLLVLPAEAARLPDLVAVPGWPTAGEAVTVLVPLAQALGRLHSAGVALTAAGPESVVLDEDGAAAWRMPPSPLLRRRAGAERFAEAVEEDRRRFAAFAEALVEKAGGRLDVLPDADPAALVDALFAVADPQPVRLAPAVAPERHGPPSRLVDPPQPGEGPASGGGRASRLSRVAAATAPLRTVRRRVWASAGGVAVGLLLAVLMLPAAGADADGEVVVRSAPSSTPSVRLSSPKPKPKPEPVAPARSAGRTALEALLRARAACLTAGDARCLESVEAVGSPVETADRTAIVAGAAAEDVDPARITVLSEGGGTVVGESVGAVVVAVRQKDGWRLRDVVVPPPT